MQEENKKDAPFDIKDIQSLIIDKSNIGTSNPVTIDKFTFNKYNLINPPQKAKRVLNSSTVKYFSQTYLFNNISQKFEQCDKTYKNIKKDKISSMKQERKWVRYCLLFMSEEEQSFFEINKETLGDFYQIQVDNLIKDKKNQKIKELKEIEREKIKEQREKEIAELKQKGEYKEGVVPSKNPLQPQPKKELKIDMNIVDNIDKNYEFDGKLYYRIYIEDLFIDKPPFPNSAADLVKYVKDFNAEIQRLLKKEMKRSETDKNKPKFEYSNIAESWCNELINKVMSMGKGKLKDEFESERFKNTRKVIEEDLKKPLLNLMFIYSRKMDNDPEIIRKGINLVEKNYYIRFKNQFDESFLKITGRYVLFLIKSNNFSKAKKVIEVVSEKCKNLKNTKDLLQELETKLKEAENKKNNENIIVSKGKIKAAADASNTEYDWQQGQNEDELNDALLKDAEQVKGNMDLINNSTK